MNDNQPAEIRARELITQLDTEAKPFGHATSWLYKTETAKSILAEPKEVQKNAALQLIHACFCFHSGKPGCEKYEVGDFAASLAIRLLKKKFRMDERGLDETAAILF